VVALAIAFCKMLLVILFFMHVRHSGGLGANCFGRRVFLAGAADGTHDERLSNTYLDSAAASLVEYGSTYAS